MIFLKFAFFAICVPWSLLTFLDAATLGSGFFGFRRVSGSNETASPISAPRVRASSRHHLHHVYVHHRPACESSMWGPLGDHDFQRSSSCANDLPVDFLNSYACLSFVSRMFCSTNFDPRGRDILMCEELRFSMLVAFGVRECAGVTSVPFRLLPTEHHMRL